MYSCAGKLTRDHLARQGRRGSAECGSRREAAAKRTNRDHGHHTAVAARAGANLATLSVGRPKAHPPGPPHLARTREEAFRVSGAHLVGAGGFGSGEVRPSWLKRSVAPKLVDHGVRDPNDQPLEHVVIESSLDRGGPPSEQSLGVLTYPLFIESSG